MLMPRASPLFVMLLAMVAAVPWRLLPNAAAGEWSVVGIDVVPHLLSTELRWRRPPDPRPGMLVRVFVESEGRPAALAIDGRTPAEHVAAGEWTWHDLPDGDARDGGRRLHVWTFNAVGEAWTPGRRIEIATPADAPGGSPRTRVVTLERSALELSRVSFQDADGDGLADTCCAHVVNVGDEPLAVDGLRVWVPADPSDGIAGLVAGAFVERPRCLPDDGALPPGQRGVVEADLGNLPRARGVIEVRARRPDGSVLASRGHLRFKVDAFAIGSGWLEIPSEAGVVPLARDSFRRLLATMHVDTAHVGEIPGLTDNAADRERFPLKLGLMSEFGDVARYSAPAWAERIHGVDALGEPQMGETPKKAHAVLARYRDAAYPTTVTLSEEKGFRFYAGLSDHPHFDAYRVGAPAADAWGLYERWGGERLRWGAPLEGIGEMTRTLAALSRPMPIAAWSQNAHEGWGSLGGRLRRSPTPDEIRVQAYEALANGATSLYWYSLQAWSLLAFRDVIDETTRIGREIRMLEPLLSRSDPHHHERRSVAGRPDWDLDTLVSPEGAILFAIDLSYEADPDTRTFRFPGPRGLEAAFPLPAFLRGPLDLFRVDADGVHDAPHDVVAEGVRVRDTVDRVAVWVAARNRDVRDAIARRHAELLAREAACGPSPGSDDAAFQALLEDLGYRSLDEVGRGPPKR